ncbi:MAG: heme-binding domain-containing protein [Phycisphaerae bacterium]|nr:heme-binding domain-containing protein [Phycisphaerae bacterium]
MSEQPQKVEAARPEKRKGRRIIAAIVVVVLLLIIALPVSNLFLHPAEGTPLSQAAAGDGLYHSAAVALESNCLDCHSNDARLPLYARLPIARGLIQSDMTKGTRYFDLMIDAVPGANGAVSEPALAKLEYVLDERIMPPMRYVALHWDRALGDGERQAIERWVSRTRQEHYATGSAAPTFAADALQPLPDSVPVDSAKVALGDTLYHDTRLSGDGTISCATCHALDTGGCDRRATSAGIAGAIGPINAPTVYNAVFHIRQFWDGRAADLKEQAGGPVTNPKEMGATWEQVLPRLEADAELAQAFRAAYPEGFSADTVTDAIAEFEKTLVTPGAKFDRYLEGDTNALSEAELAGLHLFRDNACANCHVGKNLGGQSFELMGRRADYFADRGNPTDADLGRFNVTRKERDRHAFRVPTLRNIALTYPYFHDGSQKTMKDAVKSMAHYQGYRDFTDAEAERVVDFLKTLTGNYRGRPLDSPQTAGI